MSPDLLQVIGLIIAFSALPQLPDDAQPTVSQAAVGVALGVTSGQAAALLLTLAQPAREPSRPFTPLQRGVLFPREGAMKLVRCLQLHHKPLPLCSVVGGMC